MMFVPPLFQPVFDFILVVISQVQKGMEVNQDLISKLSRLFPCSSRRTRFSALRYSITASWRRLIPSCAKTRPTKITRHLHPSRARPVPKLSRASAEFFASVCESEGRTAFETTDP